MIIAKTLMAEMPEKCGQCDLWHKELSSYGWCQVRRDDMEVWQPRPSWCPLMEVEDLKGENKK